MNIPQVGELYVSSSGNYAKVIDNTTYLANDDVVIQQLNKNFEPLGEPYRIDIFKLTMVRYSLVK